MIDRRIRRGAIYWVNWHPSRGSEQSGRRPALVVQANAGNRHPDYPNTIVAAVSTSVVKTPTHVPVQPSEINGLRAVSDIKCEQLMTISKDRLEEYIGQLEDELMKDVDEAIKRALSLS